MKTLDPAAAVAGSLMTEPDGVAAVAARLSRKIRKVLGAANAELAVVALPAEGAAGAIPIGNRGSLLRAQAC
jgi:hypothetical protein